MNVLEIREGQTCLMHHIYCLILYSLYLQQRFTICQFHFLGILKILFLNSNCHLLTCIHISKAVIGSFNLLHKLDQHTISWPHSASMKWRKRMSKVKGKVKKGKSTRGQCGMEESPTAQCWTEFIGIIYPYTRPDLLSNVSIHLSIYSFVHLFYLHRFWFNNCLTLLNKSKLLDR